MATATIENTGGSPASGSGAQATAPAGTSVSSGTASEAMIRAASSAAEPTTPASPATPKAGDTASPAGAPAPATTAPATGEPVVPGSAASAPATDAPEARIVAATRNARNQVFQDLGQALGFDRPMTRDDFRDLATARDLLAEIRSNPQGFYADLGARLGASGEPARAKDYAFPKASLRSEDGREAYSAEDITKIAAILEEKITDRLQGEMKPVLDWRNSAERAQADAQLDRDSRSLATSALTEARNLRHFKEYEADIKAVMQQVQERNPRLVEQIGPIGVLYRAYNHVLHTKVFPGLDSAAEQRVRDENNRKAAGSSLVTPSGAGGAAQTKTPLRDGDVTGLAKRMEEMSKAGVPAL